MNIIKNFKNFFNKKRKIPKNTDFDVITLTEYNEYSSLGVTKFLSFNQKQIDEILTMTKKYLKVKSNKISDDNELLTIKLNGALIYISKDDDSYYYVFYRNHRYEPFDEEEMNHNVSIRRCYRADELIGLDQCLYDISTIYVD